MKVSMSCDAESQVGEGWFTPAVALTLEFPGSGGKPSFPTCDSASQSLLTGPRRRLMWLMD